MTRAANGPDRARLQLFPRCARKGRDDSTASLTPSSENLAEPPIQLSKLARAKLALTAIASESDLDREHLDRGARHRIDAAARQPRHLLAQRVEPARYRCARLLYRRRGPCRRNRRVRSRVADDRRHRRRDRAAQPTSSGFGAAARVCFRHLVGLNLDWRFGRDSLRNRIFQRRRDTPSAFTLGFHPAILIPSHALVALHQRVICPYRIRFVQHKILLRCSKIEPGATEPALPDPASMIVWSPPAETPRTNC